MCDSLPLFGTYNAQVLRVTPVSIHGDVYYDLMVILGDGAGVLAHAVRVPSHLCDRPPREGEILKLTFLMQQVNGVAFTA